MISRRSTPLLAALLSAAALLAPTAAHAERSVTEDAAADVLGITYSAAEDGSEAEVTAPAPEETSVDITRTVVQHRTDRLRLTVSHRDLVLRRRTVHFTAFRVVTPRASYWLHVGDMSYVGAPGDGAGLSRGGRPIECPGLRWSQDEDADKVMASVPTTCVGSPRWVRVGVGAVELDSRAMQSESPEMLTFVDDGHRPGSIAQNSIAKGPKVFAG